MGMLTAGRLSAVVARWFGPASIEHLRFRFRERAWVGALIDHRATVVDIGPAGRLRLELTATSAEGVTVVDGEAMVHESSGRTAHSGTMDEREGSGDRSTRPEPQSDDTVPEPPAPRSIRLPVEAGKVVEMCRAIGLDPAACTEFAPPTFPVVIDHHGPSIVSMMEDMGYDLARVLHGVEEISYPEGPLRVEEHVEGTISYEGAEWRNGRSGRLELVTFSLSLWRSNRTMAASVVRTFVVLPR